VLVNRTCSAALAGAHLRGLAGAHARATRHAGIALADLDLERLTGVAGALLRRGDPFAARAADEVFSCLRGSPHRRPELYGELSQPQADAFAYHYERRGLDTWRAEYERIKERRMALSRRAGCRSRGPLEAALRRDGIDVNDSSASSPRRPNGRTGPGVLRTGDMHASWRRGGRSGRMVSAAEAWQRAPGATTGEIPLVRRPRHPRQLRELTVSSYQKALPHLDPPGERVEAPFEGAFIPGSSGGRAAPQSLRSCSSYRASILPRRSCSIENDFLARDGDAGDRRPGQSRTRPVSHPPGLGMVLSPLLDWLRGRKDSTWSASA